MSYLGRSCGHAEEKSCMVENGLSQEVSRSHSTVVLISDATGRAEQFVVAKYNANSGQQNSQNVLMGRVAAYLRGLLKIGVWLSTNKEERQSGTSGGNLIKG